MHSLPVQSHARHLNHVVAALPKEGRPGTQICIQIIYLSVSNAVSSQLYLEYAIKHLREGSRLHDQAIICTQEDCLCLSLG